MLRKAEETIKLDMNEVPYLPPQEVITAAQKGVVKLNRYANPHDLELLRKLLADYSGVSLRHIILSPGSDLLLREIIHTFSRGGKIIMVSPSFFPTSQAARQFATKMVRLPLTPPEFKLNPKLLVDESRGSSLVIIDNPNNPTGKLFLEQETVEAATADGETLLVIDEAYYEFSGVTFADLVEERPNLAITRTMDKAFALAGARIGYLLAGDDFLEALSSFYALLPQPSLAAAIAALREPSYVEENVGQLLKERERVRARLEGMGAWVYPSSTNFLLVETRIPDMAQALEDKGISVFNLSHYWRPGFIRVSIGAPAENSTFLSAIEEILQAHL